MDDFAGDTEALDVLSRRTEVLGRLCEGSAYKRDLAEELDQSRSTIGRAVRELEGLGLVRRTDEGVAATAAGRAAVDHLAAFEAGVEDLVAANAVIEPLPPDSAISTAVLTGGEALPTTEPVPYEALERFHDALLDAERYRAVLPTLDDPRQVRLLYEHVVTDDQPVELVVSPGLFDTLRSGFPRQMAAMADCDGFELLVGDDLPPFALGLVDGGETTTVAVVVFADNGAVHGTLVNETPAAVAWGNELFEAHRADATDRTEDLSADTDGGVRSDADGGVAMGRSLPVPLEGEGFVRLDTAYFREEPVADPTTAWRTGLSLPEVHTGYAVERTTNDGRVRGEQAGRTGQPASSQASNLSRGLLEDLSTGTDCMVVGPPGSGKSTACKWVACAWYDDDLGTVIYREGGRGRPFESVDALVAAVDAAEDHTLVVVEDAVRPEANAVFEAMRRFDDRDDVSVLLDAREREWTDPRVPVEPPDDLRVATVPTLDEHDCQRLVEQFERTVGDPVDVPADRLYEEVRDRAVAPGDPAPSAVLLLLHRLATYADPLADDRTSLEADVAAVYDDVADDDVAVRVAVVANALNAAGLGVDRAVLSAVVGADEQPAVDAALDRLEGRALFPREDGTYCTVHEYWSVAFLDHLLDAEGETAAAERFGDAVTRLLGLADDRDGHELTGDNPDARSAPASDPQGAWADHVVEAIYALGREWPKLAPLFGDGEGDSVTLPDACSDAVVRQRPAWLGWMFVDGGYFDRAERAFERVRDGDADVAAERLLGLSRVAWERGEYDDAAAHAETCLDLAGDDDRPALRARAQQSLGRAKRRLDDYEAATTHLRAALEGFERVDDRGRMAKSLSQLGLVSVYRGEFDHARERLERALGIARERGYRRIEANVLNNLGEAARREGAFDEAREHYERTLDVRRALGDRRGEAHSFGNLGIVEAIRGEYDDARDYFERSLERKRELGDRQGEANTLNNLGNVAGRLGEFDDARDYFERSLERKRELGDRYGEASTLGNLGEIVARQGEYDLAREYHERGLAIDRDIGNRHGEADRLDNLGAIATMRGEYDRAREHLERSLEIAREIGDDNEVARSQHRLGEVMRRRGEHERASERFERALETVDGEGDPYESAQVRLSLGRLTLDRGDLELARERAVDARETFAAMGATYWEARSRRLLGRVSAEAGSLDVAREHSTAALTVFEAVDATDDALSALADLVEPHRESGDDERALEWCRRAEELLAGAPEPVADQHHEWVDRHLDALDAG